MGTVGLSELLGTVALGDLGLTGIVALVILMILTDRLVTRKRLEEAREDGAGWRSVALTQQEINGEFKATLNELISLAKSTDHALRSIQSMGAAAFAATAMEKEDTQS